MPKAPKSRPSKPCPHCPRLLSNTAGLTNHIRSEHSGIALNRPARYRVVRRLSHPPQEEMQDDEEDGDRYEGPVEHDHDAGAGSNEIDAEDDWDGLGDPYKPGSEAQKADEAAGVKERHPYINGRPCNVNGEFIPRGAPPSPPTAEPERAQDDFWPFEDRKTFELGNLLYSKMQTPQVHIDSLMQLWAAIHDEAPFEGAKDLNAMIDSSPLGDVPWSSFTLSYNGELGENPETWKLKKFDVWFRDPHKVLLNQLRNPDYKDEMDFSPKRMFDKTNRRSYKDFMSGNWAWRLSDDLAKDSKYYGTTLCPVILGSDKTTVSVATGQNDYYPLYLSNGLIHNNVRRAHRDGVSLIGFLAIPKTDRESTDTAEFRRFKRELFHLSLQEILAPLRSGMLDPEVVLYADGHYRRTVFALGPYIGDYPEQVQLACIVQGWCARCTADKNDLDGMGGRRSHAHTQAIFEAQTPKQMWDQYGIIDDIMPFTHYFPRADIHELLSPDLLHQIIKGTFKDHLVTWVEQYVTQTYDKKEAKRILAEIDRRIAVVPPFPELRRFPEGRGFSQWTGNDSKALMKVYLPAVSGLIPDKMVRALSTFMEFCYLVRRSVITEDILKDIDNAVARFHEERKVFEELGVRPDKISLPRQHAMVHYRHLIQEFGAPNGLCSSITESKHIKAVKDPYRRTSKYEALDQMLVVNQRMDKLAAMRVDFRARGMLSGSIFGNDPPPPPPTAPSSNNNINDDDDDGGADDSKDLLSEVTMARKPLSGLPRDVDKLANVAKLPQLPDLIRRFLHQQEQPETDPMSIDISECPSFSGPIRVFPSAVATFFSPSGESGRHGMYRERIRAVSSWRHGPPRHDCVFLDKDSSLPGFRGLHAARVLLLFSIKHQNVVYPCALVTWFSPIGDEPDPTTGMWIVEPDLDEDGNRVQAVVHLDTIVRAAHLIGVSGSEFTPKMFKHSDSLDFFQAFYVNNLSKSEISRDEEGDPEMLEDISCELEIIGDVLTGARDARDEVTIFLMLSVTVDTTASLERDSGTECNAEY